MIRPRDITSLTDFRKNARQYLDELEKTGGVRVLTVNGKAKAVVMSPEVYEELDEEAWQAEATRRIRAGMEDVKAGRVMDWDEGMRKLANKYGIRLDA